MPVPTYRGRFAPTPSGALHFGSLIAALGSYLDARAHGGEWHLRIEDVDPPRVVPGSADSILHTLDRFGFAWNGPVVYQSQCAEAYRSTVDQLVAAGRLYGCDCTRKRLQDKARIGVDGPVYPGSCRDRHLSLKNALRIRVPATRIVFEDILAGRIACDVSHECGDFVVRRADGVFTYQLAVTVDDAQLGVTHIVRGADLLASTPRQIVLQQALGYPTPTYLHLPVALNEAGGKLSKQTLAAPLRDDAPLPALVSAAAFLGMDLQREAGTLAEFWQLAPQYWQRSKLPPLRGKQLRTYP
jgi:glutamyl-Q tRNA(Asp) synthetase